MKKLCISYARFSSARQAAGDSLRRQTEAARQYAEENGLHFDESIIDEGISAYTGLNTQKGAALARFLDRVKKGEIPPGSALVVENLDRMSRQNARLALPLFLDIINAGVAIHTTTDGLTYSDRNIDENQMSLFMTITSMIRANQESEIKSQRIRAAWKNKRKNIDKGAVLTHSVPKWLKVVDGIIVPIPERVAVVKKIFQLAKEGYGEVAITKYLVSKGIENWGWGKRGLYQGYIGKILKNPATYGALVTTHTIRGKRQPGETYEDYYPPAISKDEFFQVQAIRGIRNRANKRGGRKESRNLFPGIIRCPWCGEKALVTNSKKNKKLYRNLVCRNQFYKNGKCPGTGGYFNADELERAFLAFCNELNVMDIIDKEGEAVTEIEGKKAFRQSLIARIEEKQRFVENLFEQIEKSPALKDMLFEKMEKTKLEITDLEKECEDVSTELQTLEAGTESPEKHLDDINELSDLLKDDDSDEIRNRLRYKILQIVKSIEIYPRGLKDDDRDQRVFCVNFYTGAFKEIGYNIEIGYHILTDSSGNNPTADELWDALSKTQFRPSPVMLYHPEPNRAFKFRLMEKTKQLRTKGLTFVEIAEKFKKEGYRTSRGGPYTAVNLSGYLIKHLQRYPD